MIIPINIFILSLMMLNSTHTSNTDMLLCSFKISELRNIFTQPSCKKNFPKQHAGLFDSSSLIVLMALLALATLVSH